MASHEPLWLESGDLSVCPDLGEVRNARGECTRLGPVNMKVLALLMSRPGQVISRAEIFDAVWRNQLVGDDVLTRSISDIRGAVNRLSEAEGYVETLPKRGYRWTADVARAQAGPPAPQAHAGSPAPRATARRGDEAGSPATSGRRPWLAWAARGAIYAILIALVATLGVWAMDKLVRPGPPIVAVLPVVAEPAQRALAARLEQQLLDYLIRLDRVDLLARSAVHSRPANPFPYFHYEFGASWLVEAELRGMTPRTVLTIDLVDARTGIVLFQSSAPVEESAAQSALDLEPHLRPLELFLESRAGR